MTPIRALRTGAALVMVSAAYVLQLVADVIEGFAYGCYRLAERVLP